jgi:hypothetical protein
MRANGMPVLLKDVEVAQASLGDDTVIVGAAMLLAAQLETRVGLNVC